MATRHTERGSAMILAVMAMLIMAVLSVSFALLADIESRVGVSSTHQAQAEALAEAGLEVARDALRAASATPQGFTAWFDGTHANHMLVTGQPLNGGQYWARIDNDCAPAAPAALRESATCTPTTDTNQTAVITAWAIAGSGRSRVRAVVGVDSPWHHVCSNAKLDATGHCNEPGNRNGTPTVTPADPNDPNGPAAYDDLPRPILGCSRIAPMLHRGTVPAATQLSACTASSPGMYAYPYPVVPGAPPRFVVMGGDPAAIGVTPRTTCNSEPAGGNGHVYFGHFDCALATPCLAADGHTCGGLDRKGCLPPTDSRVILGHANQLASNNPVGTRWVAYSPALNQCGDGLPTETGMAYNLQPHSADTTVSFDQNVGSAARQFDVYVFDAGASFGTSRQFYGTFVVEGNEVDRPCSDKDFVAGGGAGSQFWAGPNAPAMAAPWVVPATRSRQYGYPLVALIYNPDLPPPTVQPTYAPQGTCADLGSSHTKIYGMIYSGGHVEFNGIQTEGTVVAYEIQTRGSAALTYSPLYGDFAPPPSFPVGAGTRLVVIRKSFVACTNYSDDSGGPTACN